MFYIESGIGNILALPQNSSSDKIHIHSMLNRKWAVTPTFLQPIPPNFEKHLFWMYLALIAWVALPYGSVDTWAWALMDVWILVLALAWSWAFLRSRLQITPVFHKAVPILVVWLIWLFYVALQCMPLPFSWVQELSPQSASLHAFTNPAFATLSVDPHSTADAFLIGAGYVLLFTLTILLVNSRDRMRWIAYTLVLSGLFQALFGTFMVSSGLEYGFLTKKPSSGIGVATGTFINCNHLAGYLEMCLSIGIGTMIAQSGHSDSTTLRKRLASILKWILSPKILLRAFLTVMVIGLVMTRSRMGNTAFFSSMMVAGILTLLLSRQPNRSLVVLLASLVVIDIFVISTWFGLNHLEQRIEATNIANEQSRLIPDQNSLSYWRDYYLTGSGLGSYYVTYFRYEGSVSRGYIQQAHNDYVQFAYETGIFGIALLAAAVLSSYYMALSALYHRHRSWNRGMAFAALMAITALMIHSDSDFNLQIPANAATFMVILALAWISRYLPSKHGENTGEHFAHLPPRHSKIIVPCVMAALAYLVYAAGSRGLANLSAEQASEIMAHRPLGDKKINDWLDASERPLIRALQLDPSNPKLWRMMSEIYSWRGSSTNEPVQKVEFLRKMLQDQLKSAELRPASPFVWADIVLTKNNLGEHDALFLAALEKTALLAPWDPSVQYRIVDIGLASWYRLSPTARQVVIKTIRRSLLTQAESIEEMIARNKREWLVCVYAQNALPPGYCEKLVSRLHFATNKQ